MTHVLRNISIAGALDLTHAYGESGYNEEIAAKPRPLTKIVCTIGPKSSTKPVLERFLEKGMNVARLNLCHGTRDSHAQSIANLRELLAAHPEQHCALLLDVSGEVRVGRLKNKKQVLPAGSEVSICSDPLVEGDHKIISLDYTNLHDVVKYESCRNYYLTHSARAGASILMSDGVSSLTVLSVDKTRKLVRARATTEITLEEQRFVYLPGAAIDQSAVLFGVEKQAEFIACVVQSAQDVRDIRKLMGDRGAAIKIIAKIASMSAIDNLDEILAESDGVMVVRGDLGVMVREEQVFVAQKMIVARCNAVHKPAIIATQMLYSMIRAPRPTRAECTDVANAVLDGADAVVLSSETESGDYPVESLEMMVQICIKADEVERLGDFGSLFEDLVSTTASPSITEVVASYAVRMSYDIKVPLIVTLTESGETSRVVCKYRPQVPVMCITSKVEVARQLCLTRATVPMLVASVMGSDQVIALALQKVAKNLRIASGSKVVVVLGDQEGVSGRTNCFKIVQCP